MVPAEDAFFASTAETGSLPTQWVDRALALLLTKEISATTSPEVSPVVNTEVSPVVSATVNTVVSPVVSPVVSTTTNTPVDPKPVVPALLLEKHKDNPRRMFASTHRKKLVINKKLLAFTRRAKPPV
jgi:hypothetical protein